mgnify:CR=1 FL=1
MYLGLAAAQNCATAQTSLAVELSTCTCLYFYLSPCTGAEGGQVAAAAAAGAGAAAAAAAAGGAAAPPVMVNVRWCQQCGRLERTSAFDGARR